MKKIITLALCVANVTCFAMNEDKKENSKSFLERTSFGFTVNEFEEKLLERRKVNALELLATSHALQTCMQMNEFNNKPFGVKGLGVTEVPCLNLSWDYKALLDKRNRHNS